MSGAPMCESNSHDIPVAATHRLDWHGCAAAFACDACADREQLAWHQNFAPGSVPVRCTQCRQVPASAADAVMAIPLEAEQ